MVAHGALCHVYRGPDEASLDVMVKAVTRPPGRRPGSSVYGGWRLVSLSRRMARRLLSNPTIGRATARVTRHQIGVYERRLPRLWTLYSKIPESTGSARPKSGEQERLLQSYYAFLGSHIMTLPLQPKISVVVPVYRPQPHFLREALESVAIQVYENWELCIVDDASNEASVDAVIRAYEAQFPERVRVTRLPKNEGISTASNAALALAKGDYVALLDHDDRLYPNALAEVVRYINLTAETRGQPPEILYSDERIIGEQGQTINEPFLKPDWSPLLHLSVNYTTHLSVYSRALLDRIGGFRKGFEGSQDHDLMLRAVEATDRPVTPVPAVLYQWRAHKQSTAQSLNAKPHAAIAGVKAVTEACIRRGTPASVQFERSTGHYRVDFVISDPKPLVSIVIPTRNALAMLARCIDSIRAKTTYPNYEIVIVDNGSDDPAALDYLRHLADQRAARVVSSNAYFNFARLCNTGVAQAKGEYVVLLNNDTEVITPDWVQAMLGLAQLPNCGAVGAKLLYEDGHVQHAGVVGLGDVIAGHSGRGRSSDDPMYVHYINTVHEAIAVTGACLCVKKQTYESVGGLDEHWVPNAYGDVDFCLRLRQRGLFSVYTPYAVLLHMESPSRKRNIETFERQYMRQRWGDILLSDPYVNPNLVRGECYAIDHRFAQAEVPAAHFGNLVAGAQEGRTDSLHY